MSLNPSTVSGRLAGHALRNANLRKRSLARAREAPPLARALVTLRAQVMGLTRLEFARRSGIGRSTLRDLELGIHTPTRRTLQQYVDFCRGLGVAAEHLEELCRLYVGSRGGLGQWIARLELRAGSPAELARRAGISAGTLWEYRRGNYPLPLAVLHRLCKALGEDPAPAVRLWHEAERERFLARGYPPALAEFWVLCTREGYAEKHLPGLGLGTATLRRLRYLELPSWREVIPAARILCKEDGELRHLEGLWRDGEREGQSHLPDGFGAHLQDLRKRKGLARREVADLFGIGGKKPARIIKSVEEDGCYSAQAYPEGLAALLADGADERKRLLELWEERRRQFHRRHRPETRIDLRLARERYGFEYKDMESILGYAPLEYQRIERGAGPLADTARTRILEAIGRAGQRRVESLLAARDRREAERAAWQSPPTVQALIARLAAREGGMLPLAGCLRRAGVKGFWAARLRAISRGEELPPWPLLEKVGTACGVPDLRAAQRDWQEQYRALLQVPGRSPLGVEMRLLIVEGAASVREFSRRLGVNPSILTRELQRMDRGKPVKWFRVERILRAAGLSEYGRRWQQIHAWWYCTRDEE
jgi:transcriptional regulator with XRE-family HTH domain